MIAMQAYEAGNRVALLANLPQEVQVVFSALPS